MPLHFTCKWVFCPNFFFNSELRVEMILIDGFICTWSCVCSLLQLFFTIWSLGLMVPLFIGFKCFFWVEGACLSGWPQSNPQSRFSWNKQEFVVVINECHKTISRVCVLSVHSLSVLSVALGVEETEHPATHPWPFISLLRLSSIWGVKTGISANVSLYCCWYL